MRARPFWWRTRWTGARAFRPNCRIVEIEAGSETRRRFRLSFIERRRRLPARRVDLLEILEFHNTITEPISESGVSMSAMRAAAQLGLSEVHRRGNVLERQVAASRAARRAGLSASTGPGADAAGGTYLVPITVGRAPERAVAEAGGVAGLPSSRRASAVSLRNKTGEWLRFAPEPNSSSS
jgi:hypothetical protein